MAKKVKRYVYEGLGFPIVLKNVPTVEVRGDRVPDINFNELQKAVLFYLCHKESPLTGNEIKFIRKYFEMTLAEFGAKLGFSHVAVLKWERHGNRFAKIELTTDIFIRLFIYSHFSSGKAFKQLYEEFDIPRLTKYQKLHPVAPLKPVAIDLQDELGFAATG